MNYYLNLYSGKTWSEFLDSGASVTGFRRSRWSTVQRIRPGDILLAYITGLSRFIAAQEVVGEGYIDDTRIWEDEDFPCRLRVQNLMALTPETAVPITTLLNQLSFGQNSVNPLAWTGHVRGSPTKWALEDGRVVVDAIENAAKNPIERPVDRRKWLRTPKGTPSRVGLVSIPDGKYEEEPEVVVEEPKEASAHTEVQGLLLKLGSDMGLDVWVARNDKGRLYQGKPFSDVPGLRTSLPRQFDDATNKTIELIDVLWLRGSSIVGAFEIESTTSIYSGLLRMSDLVSMQPNLNIPLYLVAPEQRRNRVIMEVNRPTFARLSPPLNKICRFLGFETLRREVQQAAHVLSFVKPEWIKQISESCQLGEQT